MTKEVSELPKVEIEQRIKGLLVFSQESAVVQKPIIDEAGVQVDIQRETKAVLQHITSIDEGQLEEIIDLGLAHIWKTMHCASIKINLHHYSQPDEKKPGTEKLQGNAMLKRLFKIRLFRWKTLKNELSGFRIETWEGVNTEFKQ